MQLFIRNLSGSTLSIDVDATSATPVASIKRTIADKTSIPIDAQRLVYSGKDVSDSLSLQDYGIQSESTLDLLLRLPGGEKKKRCQFMLDATEKCSSAALTMIGLCDKCDKRYCARHRLPEEHKCSGLDLTKQKAFDENKARLEREAKAAAQNLHNVAF